MNILPKKRWHVRTKENIARVRRDEAQAAEEEKERIRRAKLAEQEARTAYLRSKARLKDGGECDQPKKVEHDNAQPKKVEANIFTSEGNINFFKDLEDGKESSGTNKEYEAEKKAEQEKYEKSIGYLTYLGQDSLESKGQRAWFETNSVARNNESGTQEQVEEVGLKSKSKLDPINDIIKYTGWKPSKKVSASNTKCGEAGQVEENVPGVVFKSQSEKIHLEEKKNKERREDKKHKRKYRKEHKRKKKKHKHEQKKKKKKVESHLKRCKRRKERNSKGEKSRKRKRHYSSDSESTDSNRKRSRRYSESSSDNDSNTTDTLSLDSDEAEQQKEKQRKLEVLRAERLKREAEERRKAEKLLAGLKPETVNTLATDIAGYQQKYNSQYNPQIARQNQESKPLDPGIKYWLQ